MTTVTPSQQWIIGICSIVFDIDVGQRIEHLVPEGCLSKEEQHDVAFHSFPDSMSMELHARTSIKDSTFFFRVRRRGKLPSELAAAAEAAAATNAGSTGALCGEGSGDAANSAPDGDPASAAGAAAVEAVANGSGEGGGTGAKGRGDASGGSARSSEERFLYGFVFCRQRQDASLRRGGEQMSVVVLAEHPLSSVLLPLAAVAGHQYFGSPGRGALQQVYDEVCRWPCPVAGPQLQLPVAFTSLTARLPAWSTLPHPSTLTAPEQYGGNPLPHSRTPSSRTLSGVGGISHNGGIGGGTSRRTLTQTDDGGGGGATAAPAPAAGAPHPHRTASGMLGPGGLSPTSSNASGLLSPAASGMGAGVGVPLGSPAATAAALAASPFLGGGGAALIAVAPAQQHLERQSSGDSSPGPGPLGQRISAAAEISLNPAGIAPSGGGGGGLAPLPGGQSSFAAQPGGGSGGGLPSLSSAGSSRGGETAAVAAAGGGSLRQISGLLAEGGCSPAVAAAPL